MGQRSVKKRGGALQQGTKRGRCHAKGGKKKEKHPCADKKRLSRANIKKGPASSVSGKGGELTGRTLSQKGTLTIVGLPPESFYEGGKPGGGASYAIETTLRKAGKGNKHHRPKTSSTKQGWI